MIIKNKKKVESAFSAIRGPEPDHSQHGRDVEMPRGIPDGQRNTRPPPPRLEVNGMFFQFLQSTPSEKYRQDGDGRTVDVSESELEKQRALLLAKLNESD